MREASPFSYALLRLVPRVERGERLNVGIVLFSAGAGYLGARTTLDTVRAAALWPELDLKPVRAHLVAVEGVAAGDPSYGPIARLPTSARFHWLVAPSSTIIQPSAVHTGICDDPPARLDRLFETLVEVPRATS